MDYQAAFNIAFLGFCAAVSMIIANINKRIDEAKTAGVEASKSAKDEGLSMSLMAKAAASEAEALAIRALDTINQHKLHVAENYTSLKRLEALEAALFKKLDTIEGKLDMKADKPNHPAGHD